MPPALIATVRTAIERAKRFNHFRRSQRLCTVDGWVFIDGQGGQTIAPRMAEIIAKARRAGLVD